MLLCQPQCDNFDREPILQHRMSNLQAVQSNIPDHMGTCIFEINDDYFSQAYSIFELECERRRFTVKTLKDLLLPKILTLNMTVDSLIDNPARHGFL